MTSPKNELSPEQLKAAQIAELNVRKFYDIEPDASTLLFKIRKFAEAKPKEYATFKKMLDQEIKSIFKK